jgi:uncharacterized membrane protein
VPLETCPLCGGEIPEALAGEIESLFKPERPLSLTIQMGFGLCVSAIMLLMIPASFKPADDSIYNLLEIPPPPHMPPMVAGILFIVKTFFLLWSSYSLYRNEYRSRSLLMLLVFVFTVPETVLTAPVMSSSDFGRAVFLFSAILSLLSLILGYWYLYYWKYSRAYYESIRHLEAKKQHDGHLEQP